MIPSDLEALREIMKDRRVWMAIGKITVIEYAKDRSYCAVKVLLFPDSHEIVAKVGADAVAPDAGNYGPLSVNDMALVGIPEGLEDYAHIICRLPSQEDKIPQQAVDGHTISKSKEGKKNIVWGRTKAQIIGEERINLAKSDADVLEPLILGLVNKAFMEQWYKYFLDYDSIGVCAVGPVFLKPEIRQQMLLDKQTYLDDPDTNILSQLSFTERGGS